MQGAYTYPPEPIRAPDARTARAHARAIFGRPAPLESRYLRPAMRLIDAPLSGKVVSGVARQRV